MYFNHHPSFEVAKSKWDDRKTRINYNNLFFESTFEHLSLAEEFNSLDIEHKLWFTLEDINSLDVINFSKIISNLEKRKLRVTVNKTVNEDLPFFDLVDLLLNFNYKKRII